MNGAWVVGVLAATALVMCGIVIGIVYSMWPVGEDGPEDDPLA